MTFLDVSVSTSCLTSIELRNSYYSRWKTKFILVLQIRGSPYTKYLRLSVRLHMSVYLSVCPSALHSLHPFFPSTFPLYIFNCYFSCSKTRLPSCFLTAILVITWCEKTRDKKTSKKSKSEVLIGFKPTLW